MALGIAAGNKVATISGTIFAKLSPSPSSIMLSQPYSQFFQPPTHPPGRVKKQLEMSKNSFLTFFVLLQESLKHFWKKKEDDFHRRQPQWKMMMKFKECTEAGISSRLTDPSIVCPLRVSAKKLQPVVSQIASSIPQGEPKRLEI